MVRRVDPRLCVIYLGWAPCSAPHGCSGPPLRHGQKAHLFDRRNPDRFRRAGISAVPSLAKLRLDYLLGRDGTDQAMAYCSCCWSYLCRLNFPCDSLEDFSPPGPSPGVVVAAGAAHSDRLYRISPVGTSGRIHPPLPDRPAAESAGLVPGGSLGGRADI